MTSTFDALRSSLGDVADVTEVLCDRNLSDIRNLSDLEEAKLNVSLAYSAASLYYALQNTCGNDGSKHPIGSEIAGIKKYVARIKDVESLKK